MQGRGGGGREGEGQGGEEKRGDGNKQNKKQADLMHPWTHWGAWIDTGGGMHPLPHVCPWQLDLRVQPDLMHLPC